MVSLIAQLIIAIPRLSKLFLDVRCEYFKQVRIKQFNRNNAHIDEWVRKPKNKQDP